MKTARSLFVLLAAASLGTSVGLAQDKTSPFESDTIHGHGSALPYRLLKPETMEKGQKYPLVLFLHGFGERGTDNEKQLAGVGGAFTKKQIREKFPAFVAAPQAPASWIAHPVFDKPIAMPAKTTPTMLLVADLVVSLEKKHPIDPDRIYLMGYSNGACAVWELVERHPKSWAAAVPMSGAGDPRHMAAAAHLPIWAFHGDKDATIPVQRMHELMSALQAAKGHPLYTLIPNGSHGDAKGKGLSDPTVIPWMFAQRRGQPMVPFDTVAGPKAKRPTSLEK